MTDHGGDSDSTGAICGNLLGLASAPALLTGTCLRHSKDATSSCRSPTTCTPSSRTASPPTRRGTRPDDYHTKARQVSFVQPRDRDYLRAKRTKQGRSRLAPVYDPFVERFRDRYGFSPLAVHTGRT